MSEKLLGRKEVIARLSLSGPKQLDRLIKQGLFPPGEQVGSSSSPKSWLEQDVVAFLHLRFRGCFRPGQGDKSDDEDEEE